MKLWALLILLSFTVLGCSPPNESSLNLADTHWESRMYIHYANYHFIDSHTGTVERGNPASWLPVDTIALKIAGDSILYSEPQRFSYSFQDSILIIITYQLIDTFIFSSVIPNKKSFVSKHEYAYGHEVLFPTNP